MLGEPGRPLGRPSRVGGGSVAEMIRAMRDIALLRWELGERVYTDLVPNETRTMVFLFREWEI